MATFKPRPPQWRWSCGLCKEDHPLKSCNKFLRATDYERYQVVLLQHYCKNCLARSHRANECKTEGSCRICSKRHHTLLHYAPQIKPSPNSSVATKKTDRSQHNATGAQNDVSSSQTNLPKIKSGVQQISSLTQQNVEKITAEAKIKAPQPKDVVASLTHKFRSAMTQTSAVPPFMWPNVFIPTATVRIATRGKSDMWSYTRVLLNQCSATSKIASTTVQKLGLVIKEKEGHRFAAVHIRSRNTKNMYNHKILALITEELPRRPYLAPINDHPYEEFSEDMLADMDPRSNTLLELELGSDIYFTIRRDGVIELEMGEVIAQKTALGYVIAGPTTKLY